MADRNDYGSASDFAAAFRAGLSAPTWLYEPPPDYARYAGSFGTRSSFNAVGRALTEAWWRVSDDSSRG